MRWRLICGVIFMAPSWRPAIKLVWFVVSAGRLAFFAVDMEGNNVEAVCTRRQARAS